MQNKMKEPVDEKTACKWFTQSSEAVSYMHSKAMAHRDIKLDNILQDGSDNAKICDYGLVYIVQGDEAGFRKVLTTTKCGSLPPEMIGSEYYNPFLA